MPIFIRSDRVWNLKKDKTFENLKKSFAADLEGKMMVLQSTLGGSNAEGKKCDWESISRIVHQIRGTARSFGFSEISAVADELEQFVAKKSLEHTKRLIRRISDLARIMA